MHEQSITDIRATQCSGHISCTEVTGRWGLVSRARDADSSMHSIYKNILIFFGGFVQTFSCTHERDLNTAEEQLQREDGWGGERGRGGRGGLRLILSSGSSSIGSDSGIASSGMAVWGGGRGTLARECERS